MSAPYHSEFSDAMINLCPVNTVVEKYDHFVKQACSRVCLERKLLPNDRIKGPGWFDLECRKLRSHALYMSNIANETCDDHTRNIALNACKSFKNTKQRKKRQYKSAIVDEVENAYRNNRSDMWKILSKYSKSKQAIMPDRYELLNHFENLSEGIEAPYFSEDYENIAKDFLKSYDSGQLSTLPKIYIALQVLNACFTRDAIIANITKLKNNKSPGRDQIPAEFIKHCKDTVCDDICTLFNYMIEEREFPDMWAEGVRSAVYKAGERMEPSNYRGITVLPVFAEIFDIAVHDRLMFVINAFGLLDETNRGFLKGSMTADNMFILSTLIQKQLI